MLDSLHIENIAVIERLDVDFSSGLSVITGETGSGKSVMLDSIAFLLGAKPARELVRHGAQSGTVSAVFSALGADCTAFLEASGFPADEELMLQRTILADGKSKCRLNGRAIPQSMLRELAKYLISIHGQNDNQLLLQQSTQHKILDGIIDAQELFSRYAAAYAELRATQSALRQLEKDGADAARLTDILQFQLREIDAARLKPGEEEELEKKRVKLQNVEKIAKQSEFVYHILYGSEKGSAALILERASQAMHQLAAVIPEAQGCSEALANMRYEVEDIANTARDFAADGDGDPTAALDKVEARLATIERLRRKYGADVAAVLEFRADLVKKLSTLENSDAERERLIALQKKQSAALAVLAAQLHEKRVAAARELSAGVLAELAFLDMPAVRFEVCVTPTADFTPSGNDTVEFLIATNPGDPLLPLSKIASGGELARIMLALKSVLNDRDGVATAIFDEVDTGISGKTSRKIGIKLSEISGRTQVICVTHSAQIASLATTHYKISKTLTDSGAFSNVCVLDGRERVAEVARILGGLSVTEAQLAAARDMIGEGALSDEK